MNKDINSVFDEIHCILYLDNKERVKNTQQIFDKYNINVKYTYTFNKPIYRNVAESYPTLKTPWYDTYFENDKNTYTRLYDNVLNHYNILKSAYRRNLNNILVFEDDINIIVNKKVFNKIINKIPKDYDIIKFYNSEDELKYDLTNEHNIEFTKKFNHVEYFSCVMVGYSKKAIKDFIDYVDGYGLIPWDLYYEKIYKDTLEDKCKLNMYRLTTHFINPNLPSITCGED